MPHIAFNTGKKLSAKEKENIKNAFGKLITILPGKEEKSLMVDISDGHSLYYHGEPCEGAYVEMKMYLNVPAASKKEFAEAVFEYLDSIGFPKDSVYMTITGMENWYANGTMK